MSARQPLNPDFAETLNGSLARQGVMRLLGAEISIAEPGEVELVVPFRTELSQQHGYFHAGITTTALDSACGGAALSLMPSGSEVLSVEFKVNLLAPAAGDRLVARGSVVRAGRTITVVRGDAYAVTGVGADAREVHCATLQGTMFRVDA